MALQDQEVAPLHHNRCPQATLEVLDLEPQIQLSSRSEGPSLSTYSAQLPPRAPMALTSLANWSCRLKPRRLRCPETLFISHENANFLFSVFRVVQSEAKTPKIMGCCRANFAFLHALKIGTFRGKRTSEWVIKTSHFVLLALYFLITSKLAFSLIASQQCLARTAKKCLS